MIGSDRLEIIKQVNLQHGFQPNVQEVGNSANLASFYVTTLDGHQLSPACDRRVKLSETSFSGYFFDPKRLEAGDDEPSDKTESSFGSKVRQRTRHRPRWPRLKDRAKINPIYSRDLEVKICGESLGKWFDVFFIFIFPKP
jgi:hypothetical protein